MRKRNGAYRILEERYGSNQARDMLFAGVWDAYKLLETFGYRYHRNTETWERVMLPNRIKKEVIYTYASVVISCTRDQVQALVDLWSQVADLAEYSLTTAPREEKSDYEDRVRVVLRFRKEANSG